jgi:phenylalanyl-tRNA synthetase beta subunit
MEDVAIAYGYNNLPLRVPKTVAIGRELPLNQLCELLRLDVAMAGFTEVLTWALCSRAENFEALRRVDDGATAVSIGNPTTAEFEVCRTSLLQGALKTLGEHPSRVAQWGRGCCGLLSHCAHTCELTCTSPTLPSPAPLPAPLRRQ